MSPRRKVIHDERTERWSDDALDCRLERRHATPPYREWKRQHVRDRIPGTRRTKDTTVLEAKCPRCGTVVVKVVDRYTGRRVRGRYKFGEGYAAPAGTGPIPYEAVWGEFVSRFLGDD